MPLWWLSAEVPLKIGEPWRLKAGQRGHAIGGEEVPVPRLPSFSKAFVPRQTELQQRHERGCQHQKPNYLTIARDLCMALEKEFADGERAVHDFAEQNYAASAIEHHIHRIKCIAVGACSEWR